MDFLRCSIVRELACSLFEAISDYSIYLFNLLTIPVIVHDWSKLTNSDDIQLIKSYRSTDAWKPCHT